MANFTNTAVYFFVDGDGSEYCSNILPTRDVKNKMWTTPEYEFDYLTELPRGTIHSLFNRTHTWEDNPIEIPFESNTMWNNDETTPTE